MFTIFKELKDDEDILFSGATTVGNLFASSKVDKTKDPKKTKKQQNRAAYKNNAGWRTLNKVYWTIYNTFDELSNDMYLNLSKYFFLLKRLCE
jgi:hypothetical protein